MLMSLGLGFVFEDYVTEPREIDLLICKKLD